MNKLSVTIVIPAYNCEKTISQCLQACLMQTFSGELEIIVVDDGSTDQTSQKILAFPKVKYLKQNNSGPAAARNKGASQATGEFVCFTDSDCIPHQDWVERLLGAFADSAIGAVAGSYGIMNADNILAASIHAEIIWRHAHLMPKFPKSFGSYNFCVRKEIFKKVSGFNCAYRNASGEDNDLSYKILQSGLKILFEPKALVNHFHTEKAGKYLREQYRHGYWRAKLYFEHPSMSKGDDYTFWKDMLEVPLTTLIIGAFLLSSIHINGLGFGVFFSSLLLALEIGFAYLMIGRGAKNGLVFLFWAWIMTARAFSRTLGFWMGIVRFSPLLFVPKNKFF